MYTTVVGHQGRRCLSGTSGRNLEGLVDDGCFYPLDATYEAGFTRWTVGLALGDSCVDERMLEYAGQILVC